MNTQCSTLDQYRVLDAVDVVLAWNLSDDGFADVVAAQANLMARCYYD